MDTSNDLRLTDPELDLWVDVRLRQVDRAWLAVATLLALWSLGPDVARRMAETI